MPFVDTNVFIYAANDRSPFHSACRQWLGRACASADPWYTSWPIVYEFLRVTTHPQVMRPPWTAPEAWRFVSAILASPGLKLLVPTSHHSKMAGQLIAEFPSLSGNLMHDVHTAVLMREHGIRKICTHDADFRRFPFIEIVDPATM